MLNLYKRWLAHVQKKELFYPTDRVLVGVSGGVDSVVLLDLLNSLPLSLKPSLFVAHINHQLRENSKVEADYVRDLANHYGNSYYLHTWTDQDRKDSNVEAKARQVRYKFFEELALKYDLNKVATGHHLNDQAETVLMKLIRGGLLDSLVGIKEISQVENFTLIRPLLEFSKDELYDYAHFHKLNYFEDQTNHTPDFLRNRIRRNVLPLLRFENNLADQHILDFSKDLDDILVYAELSISQLVSEIYQDGELDLNRLKAEPPHTQRLVLKEVFKIIYQDDPSFNRDLIESIQKLIYSDQPNASLNLKNGWLAQRNYHKLFLTKEQQRLDASQDFQLSPNQAVSVSASEQFILTDDLSQKGTKEWYLGKQLEYPLRIRHRKAGDRMQVKGLGGRKKVKDIFIDQKVPRQDRDRAWLIEDSRGQIISLVGYKDSVLSLDPTLDKIELKLLYRK